MWLKSCFCAHPILFTALGRISSHPAVLLSKALSAMKTFMVFHTPTRAAQLCLISLSDSFLNAINKLRLTVSRLPFGSRCHRIYGQQGSLSPAFYQKANNDCVTQACYFKHYAAHAAIYSKYYRYSMQHTVKFCLNLARSFKSFLDKNNRLLPNDALHSHRKKHHNTASYNARHAIVYHIYFYFFVDARRLIREENYCSVL